ncbi:meiosis specific with OB domains hold'em isoform X2 [Leptinotarsa decemlineata]|uniref:meiosis specific with OB domains hold'em isoform X2 n=1 Tax=Leptinotarsa decemlineata TaxID=7539 RepID=UPI003D30582A
MNDTSVALQKVNLRRLHPYLDNILIVGIIIGKQRPRKFLDKKSSVEVYRGVWNFTLRDSPQDYINITYWGPSEVIFQANEKFRTGDVVEIINPKINVRILNDTSEQFRPMVTSPYNLTLNEKSSIVHHAGMSVDYLPLLKFPTKPIAGFLPLRDIHNSGASIKDFIDVLAVVRGLGQVRTITSKTNEIMLVRTVEVFDHTCPSLKIDIWDPDIINRSEKWTPRFTALFFTDLIVLWSNFQRQFIAKVSNRTIVTENPEGKEVQLLLDYAKDAPIETFEIVDQFLTTLPDPSTIRDIMSVKQIQDKINASLQEVRSGSKQFTALLFAFVSNLDLDGLSQTLMITCGKCKMPIKGSLCENSECSTVYENEVIDPEFKFDIKITLSDHTGTLTNCRFRGEVVEQALSCTSF